MLTDKICLSQEFYRATEIKSVSTRQQLVQFCCEKQKSLKDLTMKSDEKAECMPRLWSQTGSTTKLSTSGWSPASVSLQAWAEKLLHTTACAFLFPKPHLPSSWLVVNPSAPSRDNKLEPLLQQAGERSLCHTVKD